MNKLRFALILFACNFMTPLIGGAEGRTVTVLASMSCSVWKEGREEEKSVEPLKFKYTLIRAQFWVLGFVSGLNAGSDGPNLLESVDSLLVFDWMDRFCANNPNSDLFDGANDLLKEVAKKRRK